MHSWNRIPLLVICLLLLAALPMHSSAQMQANPWDACRLGAFSVEEDFVMQEGEPADGNPYISDGDMLSLDGRVCARNKDLLKAFSATAPLPDLGLDALDLLDPGSQLAAFSSELDHPGGLFTAGDLLFTDGRSIPNVALVAPFGIAYDIGLDAVQLMGSPSAVRTFVDVLGNYPYDRLVRDPGLLDDLLKENKVDIWFSIEGTYTPADSNLILLDGDLLSAATGTIVLPNSSLLPATVPAGIPSRGVDFGLDAVAVDRILDLDKARAALTFSTEILFRDEKTPFTDGDILKSGNGIHTPNATLVAPFKPAADFLGLDALSGPQALSQPEPMIDYIGNRSVWDIDGGFVAVGGGGSGLYYSGLSGGTPTPPRRPFGWFIPVDGYLTGDITEFRVAFRPAGTAPPAPGAASAIQTSWIIREWYATPPYCRPTGTLSSDANGWFDAAQYRFHQSGSGGCSNGGLVLAVWDTLNDPNVTDKDGHYVIWLEWRTGAGGATVFREPADHHVQLDNTAPAIHAMELRTLTGTVIPPCGGATSGQSRLTVYADFEDEYFLGYRLRVRGGNPPASKYYPGSGTWHSYWDGAPYAANLDMQGTTPAGLQLLREIDMTDLGASYVECCYVLDLWISDAAIRHNFNRLYAYPDQPGWAWPNSFLTFAAAP